MVQELGETRSAMAQDCCKMAEEFAHNMKSEVKPFYIVFHAKPDRHNENCIRQSFKAYYERPQKLLGVLLWYVNNPLGEFKFIPELSSPPDMPIDASLLSTRSEDFFPSIACKASDFNVIMS